MDTIKVRATVNILGLTAGQEAEIDLTSVVKSALRARRLLHLVPIK